MFVLEITKYGSVFNKCRRNEEFEKLFPKTNLYFETDELLKQFNMTGNMFLATCL